MLPAVATWSVVHCGFCAFLPMEEGCWGRSEEQRGRKPVFSLPSPVNRRGHGAETSQRDWGHIALDADDCFESLPRDVPASACGQWGLCVD